MDRLCNYSDFPALLGINDLLKIFPLSRAGVYNLLNSEGFPVIRIGKRLIIPKQGLIEWLERNTGGKEG